MLGAIDLQGKSITSGTKAADSGFSWSNLGAGLVAALPQIAGAVQTVVVHNDSSSGRQVQGIVQGAQGAIGAYDQGGLTGALTSLIGSQQQQIAVAQQQAAAAAQGGVSTSTIVGGLLALGGLFAAVKILGGRRR